MKKKVWFLCKGWKLTFYPLEQFDMLGVGASRMGKVDDLASGGEEDEKEEGKGEAKKR